MLQTKLAKRYAKSLISLSQEQNSLEVVHNDMRLIAGICSQNNDFSLFLRNPLIFTDKKINILDAIFENKISVISMNFLRIITRKRREFYVEAIAEEVIAQYREIKGIMKAVITTATGIDAQLRTEIVSLVKKEAHAEVELVESTDPDIIGGFLLRFGNIQYDTTVARELRSLRRSFSKNLYIGKIKNK